MLDVYNYLHIQFLPNLFISDLGLTVNNLEQVDVRT